MSDITEMSYEDTFLYILKIMKQYGGNGFLCRLKRAFISPIAPGIFDYLHKSGAFEGEMDDFCKRYFTEGKSKKEIGKIKRDYILSLFRYGATPWDYSVFEFEKRSDAERANYVTAGVNTDFFRLLNGMYNGEERPLLDDKFTAVPFFKNFYRREILLLDEKDKISACCDMLKRLGEVVAKPELGSGGEGFRIIKESECENPEEEFKKLLEKDKWLIEQRIIQGKELSEIHSSSVNTIRAFTFTAKKSREVKIAYTLLRMGVNNNLVDNYSSGGIVIHVDTESGALDGKIYAGTGKYLPPVHPTSGVKLDGYRLPEWDKMKEAVIAQAKLAASDGYNLVGWDMAYSTEGWVMVEANNDVGPLLERVLERGMKDYFDGLLEWALNN